MSQHNYSPYGAYELKAAYHKNLIIGNIYVLGTALLFIFVYYLSSLIQTDKPVVIGPCTGPIEISKDIPSQPTIIREATPEFEPRQRQNQGIPQYAIPVPVDDSLYIEDEIDLMTITDPVPEGNGEGSQVRDHPYDPDAPTGGIGGGGIEYIPEPGMFVPHEKPPVMIHKEMPEFPRLCRTIGLEGIVLLHVLVGINGDVKDVRIAKSSENASFDSSAKKAAYKNKYSPAIQNGNPITLWIGYKVEFKLER